MKKFLTLLFTSFVLLCSCSQNGNNKLTDYFTVTAGDDGLLIQTYCGQEYSKNYMEVYDVEKQQYNVSVCSIENSAEVFYPFVTKGKQYNIKFYVRDSNRNLSMAFSLDNITAQGGLGDFSISKTGESYDGNKTVTPMGYKFNPPINLDEDGDVIWYGSYGQVTFVSSDRSNYVAPEQKGTTVDYKTGTITIDESVLNNPPSGYTDFITYSNFQFQYKNNIFIQEFSASVYHKKGISDVSSWTNNKDAYVTSTSNGFNIIKYYDSNYPNVRVKVYNETQNHYCPTVKLNEYYKNFDYDYVNGNNYYSVEFQYWDSNWSNYKSSKIENIKALGGKGDFYFVSDGFEYEQGDPTGNTANIHLKNAEFVKSSSRADINYTVSGNLYYFSSNGNKQSVWKTFDYNYDSAKKDLTININSELPKIRGKTFYAQLSANWDYNDYEYELSICYNENESDRFVDEHEAYVNKITNNYTVLFDSGKCEIASELQGKAVYLIKYNNTANTLTDKSPVYAIAHAEEFYSRYAEKDDEKQETGWKDSVYDIDTDLGQYLGLRVPDDSRSAGETYTVGQKKQFNEGNATLKYISDHSLVWYCNNNQNADEALNKSIAAGTTSFETVGKKFDALFDTETAIIGSNIPTGKWSNVIEDIDENSKINIFIFDINNDYVKGKGGTLGYFHGKDFIKKASNSASNECEIIYIDSGFLANSPKSIYSTLTHEFQHLLTHVNKYLNKNIGYDSWYTEMMSLGTEIALQTKCLGYEEYEAISGRISAFNGGYHYGFENWSAGDVNCTNYANAAVFMDYLMKNYGGIALLHEIAQNNYTGEEAVNKALKASGYSETFDTVMMKMGKMIVNSYDTNSSASELTLNKEYTFNININGKAEAFNFKALDITKSGVTIPNDSYQASFRVFNTTKGPSILKPGYNFKEIYTKAIGVYQLTNSCGAEINIENPGDGYQMALYFK